MAALETRTLRDPASRTEKSPLPRDIDERNERAWELVPVNIVRANELAAPALTAARSLGYVKGVGNALLVGASHDFFMAKYESSLAKADEARRLLERAGDDVGASRVLLMKALTHWSLGDFETAVKTLHRCAEMSRETNQEELEAWVYTSLGSIYTAIGDLLKATALHARAFASFTRIGYVVGQGRALTGLGAVYYRQGRYEAALEQHRAGLSLFRSVPSELSEALSLHEIGTVLKAEGKLDESLVALERALKIRRKFGNRPAVITTLVHLGELHVSRGDTRTAIELLEEARALAGETHARPKLHQAHEALSRAHEAAGDFRTALSHQRRAQRIREVVLSDEAAERLKNLQIRHEVETAEREAEIQRLRNVELAEALHKLTQTQAQLVQAEKLASLGKLVAGVAHEMNTPVGALTSAMDVSGRLLSRLEESSGNEGPNRRAWEAIASSVEMATSASRRISKIVKSLELFARVDRAEYQRFDLHENLECTLDLLAPKWGSRIRVEKRLSALPTLEGYPASLNQALMTLLVNAGEAIQGEGTITVETSSTEEGWVRLAVSDDGMGIAAEQLERVFEVGFSRKGARIRMHTGLANVYATVVDLHGGEIDVRSELGKGTSFEIFLPVRRPSDTRSAEIGPAPAAVIPTA